MTHLMPALPWPHEDFARSSSNMLFQTARLTADDNCDGDGHDDHGDDVDDAETHFLHAAFDLDESSQGQGKTCQGVRQALAIQLPA